jgi:putative NIF3 family GTP cyclohydrolase 1 type 2
MALNDIAGIYKKELGGEPVELAFGPAEIRSVAVVSGSGSSTLAEAISKGLDCFVTGEGRHEDHHLALEGRINALYIGHYQSETLGVKAMGKEIAAKFGVETVFIDEPTVL